MKLLVRILKWFFISILSLLVLILIFLAFAIAPIDRTPVQQLPPYQVMMSRLDSIGKINIPKSKHAIEVGYSKVNLTPPFKTATAGYGNRKGKDFTELRDSLFVRTIVVDNGTQRAAIVSADLLIIPPTVTARLETRLAETGFNLNNTFLGATHTHNGIGNWAEGAAQVIYGGYDERVTEFITDAIVESIVAAQRNLLPAKIESGAIEVPAPVHNRLIPDGFEDAHLRVLTFHRSDSVKLLMMNYTAHATCLFSKDLRLSRDYPGALVDAMEVGYCDFAMFMSGAVGSHGCKPPAYGEECIGWMAEQVSTEFLKSEAQLKEVSDSSLYMLRIPLELGPPQVKVTEGLKVREWLFRSTFGEYPVHLTALRIGNVVLLGTPCDYSGEFYPSLDSVASAHNLDLMVTSFNGGYIGYVTPSKYYDRNHYETRLMNWYAPGNGEYLNTCLLKLEAALGD